MRRHPSEVAVRGLLAGAVLLLAACSSPRREERLFELRRAEDRRAYSDSLAQRAREGDTELRLVALRAIGRIGHPDGRPVLEQVLDDEVPALRAEAAFALGILGDEAAGPALLSRLRNETDAAAMGELVLAIGRLQLSSATEALLPLARQGHPFVREQCVEALALLADSTSVPTLIELTRDELESVVWRAAYALEKIPGDAQVPRLIELLAHSSALVRGYAMRSLGRLGAADASEAVAAATRAATGDWQLMVQGCEALGRIADAGTHATLDSALTHPNFHVRTAAAAALGRMRSGASVSRLSACRQDSVVNVRVAAYTALADILGEDAGEQLLAGLNDASDLVVSACLQRLGADAPGLAALEAAIGSSEQPNRRSAAVAGLRNAGAKAPRETLRAALADADWVVATSAADVIGQLPAPELLDDLLLGYRSRSGPGRQDFAWQVLQSLALLRDPRAVELCRQALASEDDVRLRLAAAAALRATLSEAEAAELPSDVEIARDVRRVRRSPQQPALVSRSQARQLVLRTDHGPIIIDLLPDEAPQMVENFARLAERGFFDGLSFHRVVPNFVIQGGDPLGSGWGDAGYTIRSEWNRLRYERGMVGLAHSGKDTGSCQFFITHWPQPHLNARYTIFGRVVAGMEVVDRVQMGDRFSVDVRWAEAER